jgi:hypothetical protein
VTGTVMLGIEKYKQSFEEKTDTKIILELGNIYYSQLNGIVMNTNLDVTEVSKVECNKSKVYHFCNILRGIEDSYSTLLSNPSLLSSLSPQFRKNLGGFAMNVNTYKNKKYDVADLTYMYENLTKLRKQERCIELEMAFLDGDIPSDDYKTDSIRYCILNFKRTYLIIGIIRYRFFVGSLSLV